MVAKIANHTLGPSETTVLLIFLLFVLLLETQDLEVKTLSFNKTDMNFVCEIQTKTSAVTLRIMSRSNCSHGTKVLVRTIIWHIEKDVVVKSH